MARGRACERCGTRCVVGAELECLACGHVLRPGNDRTVSISTVWRDTVTLPAEFAEPDSRHRFEDEETA